MKTQNDTTNLSNDKETALDLGGVGKSLLDESPNMSAAYSTRKLHSSVNNKCTCKKPDGVKDGGYCYMQDKLGNYRKPCELGVSLQDVLNGADVVG